MFKRLIMNARGKAQGFSGCSHCGDRWNWVEGKNIPFTPHCERFMFPLCTSCFERLSAAAIIRYCYKLFESWQKELPDRKEPWDEYRSNVYRAVLYMKGVTKEVPFPGVKARFPVVHLESSPRIRSYLGGLLVMVR
jgi:hypothetical protein